MSYPKSPIGYIDCFEIASVGEIGAIVTVWTPGQGNSIW